ncbi:MAG: response regulator transcription factor [Deltaproteobacteria bacterium]|nr:response regulator transcription factor [Deltaproteobacteria bacterium]MBK9366136.1 response regulator transcription factor [Deltaproteobacteria bacterium]
MIRVGVADDHPLLRSGLRRVFEAQTHIKLVLEAEDGAVLLTKLAAQPCDVLVLDLSLPYLRGIELVRAVVERHPALRVLIYSVQPEDRLSLHLLDAGAAGYLSKDHGADELLRAIQTVARGERYLTPALRELLALDPNEPQIAPHERLSARELAVFQLLLRGMNVADIADELEIQASTASNHLARIREKLGVQTNGEALLYAFRAGLLSRHT